MSTACKVWLTSACLLASAVAFAASAKPATVVMQVAVDATTVDIRFAIANQLATGFAGEVRTPDDAQALAVALDALKHVDTWLHPNAAARCRSASNSLATAAFNRRAAARHPTSGPPKTTMDVEHRFVCDAPEQLTSLEVALIERFPRVRKLVVNLTLPNAQRTAIVTTPRATISLRADGS